MIGWSGVRGLEFHNADKEIYYLIGREYWNKGYASEAVSGLVDYCFHQMQLPRLVAKVDARNIASKKIIEKLGFQFDHVISGLPQEFSRCNGELYYRLDNPN
jgi:ribosomal-protein-alanine N-acetyltransferase